MNFIMDNIQYFINIAVGAVVYFITKYRLQKLNESKSKADILEINIENVSATFEVYQDLLNDLEKRFKLRIEDLEEDLEKLKLLNQELRKQIGSSERYIRRQQLKIDKYEKLER